MIFVVMVKGVNNMGYCMQMIESTVSITKDNALKIMEFLPKYIYENAPNWKWVDIKSLCEYCKINNFIEVMYELRYEVYEEDSVYKIDCFSGEKLGDDFDIFVLLAPYINNGYIEMVGEDGDRWRWIFKDGKCEEKFANNKGY